MISLPGLVVIKKIIDTFNLPVINGCSKLGYLSFTHLSREDNTDY
jgi:hypothetical protein